MRPFGVLYGDSEEPYPCPFSSFSPTAAFPSSPTSKLFSNLLALGSASLGANEVAFLSSTWRDMEHFDNPHSTGCKISTSGVLRRNRCIILYVDGVILDAPFRPKRMTYFCESHLGARGQVECFYEVQLSQCWGLQPTPWLWRCPRPFFLKPSPMLCSQQQVISGPPARFPQARSSQTVL